jgi:hypothetical protein
MIARYEPLDAYAIDLIGRYGCLAPVCSVPKGNELRRIFLDGF